VLILNKADKETSGDCCVKHTSTSEVNCYRPICHPVPPFYAAGDLSEWLTDPDPGQTLAPTLPMVGHIFFLANGKRKKTF
jgi:hypothetical protein